MSMEEKIQKWQTEQQLLLTILLVRKKNLSSGTIKDFIHRDFYIFWMPNQTLNKLFCLFALHNIENIKTQSFQVNAN